MALQTSIELVGVLISLITLAVVWIQLRSIERNQRANTVQNLVDAERDLWSSALCENEPLELMKHHMGVEEGFHYEEKEISPEQALWISMFLRQYENIYYQHLNDMLPPGLFEHWLKSMGESFKRQYVRDVFDKLHILYSEDFKEFVHDKFVSRADKEKPPFDRQNQAR